MYLKVDREPDGARKMSTVTGLLHAWVDCEFN